MDRIVVVGASLAAVHAIEGLRELGFGGPITLVGGESHLPYGRPALSKEALRNGPDEQALLLREPAWFDEVAVDLLLGVPAAELDVANQQLTLEDGAQLGYDGMVIATGSKPMSIASGSGRIHTLRTIEDCLSLHRSLVHATHVAVVGAGFIGLEVAATAREMGLDVSLVEVAPVPLTRVLGDEVGEWFHAYHARHGVEIHTSSALWSVDFGPRGATLTIDGGRTITADVVVAGVGVVPATDWLRTSGLALSGGVLCDRALRTSAGNIVAAGDVARWYNPLFDEDMRVEQWANAVEQGRHAAMTLLGATDAYAAVPYLWSNQFDAKMRFVGRTNAADQIEVDIRDEDSLVAVFGRNGVEVGALCVNAPRDLPAHRQAILDRAPMGAIGSNTATTNVGPVWGRAERGPLTR